MDSWLYWEERLLVVTDKKTRATVCTHRDRNMPPSSVSMKSVAPLLARGKLHFHCTKIHVLVTRNWKQFHTWTRISESPGQTFFHSLTIMHRTVFHKLLVPHQITNFIVLFQTRNFITVFTRYFKLLMRTRWGWYPSQISLEPCLTRIGRNGPKCRLHVTRNPRLAPQLNFLKSCRIWGSVSQRWAWRRHSSGT
jgi:hypothetical protein